MLLAVGSTMRRGAMPALIAGAPRASSSSTAWFARPTASTTICAASVFTGRPWRRARVRCRPQATAGSRRPSHFRVVLPDQRGTGRSSCVDGRTIKALGDRATAAGADTARSQADFLKRHLASSIVRDFEYLRLVGFGGKPWVTLGQSYGGGFDAELPVALPEGVAASFTCGGIPHVPASASEVYAHLPAHGRQDAAVLRPLPADVEARGSPGRYARGSETRAARRLADDGRAPTAHGSDFGMKPSFERMHWIIDHAFVDGDGTLACGASVSDSF